MKITDITIQFLETTRRSLFFLPVRNVIQSIQGGAMMGAFVQCVCLIDYIAYISNLDGTKGGKYNYKIFIDDYLKRVNLKYDGGKIYVIRCSLVHTFGKSESMKEIGVDTIGFSHAQPSNHLAGQQNEALLDLGEFFPDIIHAIWDYFEEVAVSNDIQKISKIASGCLKLIGIFEGGKQNLSETYGQIHPILGVLDREPVDWNELKNRIKDLCLNIEKSKWYCKC